MSDAPDYRILISPGLTEKQIAEALRSGPSEAFLKCLAAMLDPLPIAWQTPEKTGPVVSGTHDENGNIVWDDEPKSPKKRPTHKQMPYKLKLARTTRGRPKGTTKLNRGEAGQAMLKVSNLPRGKAKKAKGELAASSKVDVRTVETAKYAERDAEELWAWVQSREAPKE